ncbi:hypothetical protein PCASD_07762 [Puccinia coronata f. sp. avenae]|uniref:Uncharacterized protein n=1 Tax=Puccinia coronata f. sp. avenae TaxID=200324 RepID=A0A2N5UX06_9BASI|nr:hypothetical protein PCASD_07762 [Puccinia coronata f. sp. avenae]
MYDYRNCMIANVGGDVSLGRLYPSLTQSPRFGGLGEPRRAGGASRSEPPSFGGLAGQGALLAHLAIPGASDKERDKLVSMFQVKFLVTSTHLTEEKNCTPAYRAMLPNRKKNRCPSRFILTLSLSLAIVAALP